MGADRMFLLKLGQELLPKSISVRGASDRLVWSPIIALVVHTDAGIVLLETGISRAALEDSAAIAAIYGEGTAVGIDGEPLVTALADIGLRVDDLALAAVSHLHIDHSGGIALLAEHGVPIVIQRREHDFAMTRAGLAEAYYHDDYRDRDVRWRIIDGDGPIAPGIEAIFTPGHTPGHMSYRIDLPETGPWLMTIDAADFAENLADAAPPGACADPADEERAVTSLERLVADARRIDARLVPGHDMLVWRAVRHPPGGHR